jgi:hypothetical protein
MKSKLFFAMLLLIGSTSLMAQTSYEAYLERKFATPTWETTTIVDRWDAVEAIDAYKINVTFVKYSDGSHDVNYEDRIMKVGGDYIDIDCTYLSDFEIRCDYEAFKHKVVDTSSWWAAATTYAYDERYLSGFFTLER